MWNRALIKEEAKKVFTYKDNYWRFILAALIIVLLTGGISGGISGGIGGTGLSFVFPQSNSKNSNSNSGSSSHGSHKHTNVSYYDDHGDWEDFDDYIDEYFDDYDYNVDGWDEEYYDKYDDEPALGDIYEDDHGDWDDEKDIPDFIKPYLNDDIEDALDDARSFGRHAGMWAIFGAIAVFVIIVSLIATAIGLTVKAFLINPIVLGAKTLFLRSYDRPSDLKDLICGFKNNYIKNVGTLILKDIFTILWTLLFIVPGIIKAYEYRMIPYLISENPDMSYKEAFTRSKDMMMGNKWEAFVLDLSFLGWFLLNMLTCGILGIFYVNPYYFATDANLYRAIKMGGSTGYVSSQYATVPPVTPVGENTNNMGNADEAATSDVTETVSEETAEQQTAGEQNNDL